MWKYLGPGLLYAGAAIGVSHLVQSTRAGAMYGMDLALAIVIVNLLKYPFFEIGTRYTIATGRPLQEGYLQLGLWALLSFFAITIGTMFIIVAVVTLVTAGLLQNLLGIVLETWAFSGLLLILFSLVLFYGKYKLLDSIIKIIIILMTISTIGSLIIAVIGAPPPKEIGASFQITKDSDILFLIALLGWMPIPIEAAVWQSDWTLESRKKFDGNLPPMKYALLDFHIGYWGTTILALVFLSLGAIMMHGSGEEFSPKAVEFSHQLIDMISKNLGDWAYPWIAIGASMTMISTTITCLDAYPRVLTKTFQVTFPKMVWKSDISYRIILIITALGSFCILYFFQKSMRTMVDFATSISFVTAPILAFIHYKIAISSPIKELAPVSKTYRFLSWIGICFLVLFSIYYIYLEYNH